MSVEEDTELRDLISQTLEANGCFAKIRAQLRANIYLALDEDEMFQKKEFLSNKKLHSVLETVEGKMMFCIVREFLEHFDLEFTISVFEPESYMGLDYEYPGRCKLIENLNIPGLKQESSDPVLLQLLQLSRLNSKLTDIHIRENSVTSLNCKNDLLSQDSYNENNSIMPAANDTDISNKSSSGNSISGNAINETFDIKTHSFAQLNSEPSAQVSGSENDMCNLQREKSLIDFDKSLRLENTLNKSDLERNKCLIDQTILETDFSPPVVKDSKHTKFDTSFDKLKLSSPKSDKIKVKNNLSSLSDLPPLQMTKSRTNDMLLPSLYTKDFKDKGNTKDIDKLFELEPLDNYEEDFISESEIDLTVNKQEEISEANTLGVQHVKVVNKDSVDNESGGNEISENQKAILDNNSTASSVTSEDFEVNSNIDDILNSC